MGIKKKNRNMRKRWKGERKEGKKRERKAEEKEERETGMGIEKEGTGP